MSCLHVIRYAATTSMTRTVSSTRLTSIWRVVLRKPVLSINYRGRPGYGVDFRAANGSGLGSGWQGGSREADYTDARELEPAVLWSQAVGTDSDYCCLHSKVLQASQ